MIVAQQAGKLSRFIARNPALADVPFGIVRGMPITPRQALAMLRRGEAVSEIVQAMVNAGIDPPEDWELAEAYYKNLLQLPGPHPKIYVIGQEMTLEEALTHIRLRDAKGQELLRGYQSLQREMARRLR